MKKLIALTVICMAASVLPALAETADKPTAAGSGGIRGAENMSPEQREAKIDERIKKLEEHKARAVGNGKTEIANAIQGLIDAFKNLKSVMGSKNRESIRAAIEEIETARDALEKLVPGRAKERCSKGDNNKETKKQGKNSP
jgi:hypothetical protein